MAGDRDRCRGDRAGQRARPTSGGRGGLCRRSASRHVLLALVALVVLAAAPVEAFRVTEGASGWLRWDAAPREVDGLERSLAGGLRYSIEHGDYQALRDEFLWLPAPPSVADFRAAVARAFENWTVVDPVTGLPAGYHFVEDLATPAVDDPGVPASPNGHVGANPGAEIDLFAETPHAGPAFGASVVVNVARTTDDLTLVSGTTGYPGRAIAGADIRINPAYVWTLEGFELLLTHEIGHALGLADLEFQPGQAGASAFLDDDYDPSTAASALATLTDSFSLEIDRFDPDGSPWLMAFEGDLNADPGLDTPGVELLMETEGIFDLLRERPYLQADEFAARQFLYPVSVPEPRGPLALGAGLVALLGMARRAASTARAGVRPRRPAGSG
ncbi:MAG: hypothetical protein H6748_00890 [Spirochaetaceae bacterium]|nr:hypothetical protein [Spirochaetaceae bacterium]